MTRAYYNENDPDAAKWLRGLIADGLISPGVVDERSIVDVKAADLVGYSRVHLFAGIGGWDLALQLAGWPADLPVWTGSCPCQPFSNAGSKKGTADDRHLWPEMSRLIREYNAIAKEKIHAIFGEQVASAEVVGTELEAAFALAVQAGDYARANKLAKALVKTPSFGYDERWMVGVQTDLEGEGYTSRAKVLGAHSVGSPHIRQRLWWAGWLGDADNAGLEGHAGHGDSREGRQEQVGPVAQAGSDGGLADAAGERIEQTAVHAGRSGTGSCEGQGGVSDGDSSSQPRGLANPDPDRLEAGRQASKAAGHGYPAWAASGTDRHGSASAPHSGWSAADWLWCRDGKWRPVEPGTSPLVNGLPRKLVEVACKGFGNAIVPQAAAAFIEEVMSVIPTNAAQRQK